LCFMATFISMFNGVRSLLRTITNSVGVADADKIPNTNSLGKLDDSLLSSNIVTIPDITNRLRDVRFIGLTSDYYYLGSDFAIVQNVGGQSGAYSFWGLQLGGIRGAEIYPFGTGAGRRVPPVLNNIQNPNSFCVGIRTQATNDLYGTLPSNFAILALYSTAWQTSGSYLDCRNTSNASIFRVDLNGNLFVRDKAINLITPPSEYLRVYSDFIFNLGDFSSGLTGTGTAVTFANIDTGNRPGIATLSTGTTATGSTRVGYGTSTGQATILFGFAEWKYETSVMLPTLSDATETYSVQSGFTDNPIPVDGVYFRYTDTENVGRWQACTKTNNNAINSIDTGIAVVANQWYRQTIIINPAGTLATFFIDGVQVASTALSIPIGAGRQTGLAVNILKTLGITARLVNVDYIDVVARFTTPR
jgi:hypothetical protein